MKGLCLDAGQAVAQQCFDLHDRIYRGVALQDAVADSVSIVFARVNDTKSDLLSIFTRFQTVHPSNLLFASEDPAEHYCDLQTSVMYLSRLVVKQCGAYEFHDDSGRDFQNEIYPSIRKDSRPPRGAFPTIQFSAKLVKLTGAGLVP